MIQEKEDKQIYKSGFLIFLTEEASKQPTSIESVIVFDSQHLQESCINNNWNISSIQVQQLKLGLEYQTIKNIKKSLKSLFDCELYRITVAQILMDACYKQLELKINNQNQHYYSSQLLEASIQYVTKLIQAYQDENSILNSLAEILIKMREIQNEIYRESDEVCALHQKEDYIIELQDISDFCQILQSSLESTNTNINYAQTLLDGNYSTLLLNLQTLQIESQEQQTKFIDNLIDQLIFNLLQHELSGIQISIELLKTCGKNSNDYLRKFAFSTTERLQRLLLFTHLSHTNGCSQVELQHFSYLRLIEELYPNHCYQIEFCRIQSQNLEQQNRAMANIETTPQLNIEESFNLFPRGDFEDWIPIQEEQNFLGWKENLWQTFICKGCEKCKKQYVNTIMTVQGNSEQNEQFTDLDSHQFIITPHLKEDFSWKKTRRKSGYLRLKFKWIAEWDEETKDRVILEKSWNQPLVDKYLEHELESKLKFILDHQDADSLQKFVEKLHEVELRQIIPCVEAGKQATQFSIKISQFMEEEFRNILAKKGLFLYPENKTSYNLIRRLAFNSMLFKNQLVESHFTEFEQKQSKNLQEIHQKLQVAKVMVEDQNEKEEIIHNYFISFCIREEYYLILYTYLNHYSIQS